MSYRSVYPSLKEFFGMDHEIHESTFFTSPCYEHNHPTSPPPTHNSPPPSSSLPSSPLPSLPPLTPLTPSPSPPPPYICWFPTLKFLK